MKRINLLLLLLVLSIPLMAAKPKWEPLFNGKDLSGWKQLNGNAPYVAKNQEIVGTCVKNSPNSFLCTERQFGDFILELEVFIDPGINSGVQIRSESKPDYQNGRVHGYQVEIDHDQSRRFSGGVYDEARRLWLYPLQLNPKAQSAYRFGQWNHYRMECIGTSIRTFVNGVPCAHVVDDMTMKGFIGLQVHAVYRDEDAGKQVRWRNIRIQTQDLQPSPPDDIRVVNLMPNTLSGAEKRLGFRMLWDANSTKGWRGAYKTTFPDKGWEISNGELVVQPSGGGESLNGGDIVTVDTFGAFEMVFDFKLTPGANSGVKYFVSEKYEVGQASAIGLEYQLLDDATHPDAKLGAAGNRTLASLYDLIPSEQIAASKKQIGEWNQGRIVVYPNNRVQHFLNGYKVVDYERKSNIFKALVARSKYAQWPDFGMGNAGHILLQDHGNQVFFRSIKIRVLTTSPAPCE